MPAFEIIVPVMRPLPPLSELGACDEPVHTRPPTETHIIRWMSHALALPEDSGVFKMAAGGAWLRWQCVIANGAPIVLLEQP
jgi:hypothetical protein